MRLRILLVIIGLITLLSCSTTRVLQEGQYRLSSNEVVIVDDPDFKISRISPYIRQQANPWSPGLLVYNMSSGKNKGLDRLFEKLGKAPVVFNPALVESSKQNIVKRLEYLGYYNSKVEADILTSNKIAKVIYTVTLGKRYKIDEILYDLPKGNPEFAQDFYADTLSQLFKCGDYLSEELFEEESQRSASVLRNKGYFDFSKNNYFFIVDTLTPGHNVLQYSIKGYTRNESPDENAQIDKFRFGSITINYSASVAFREKLLRDINLLKPGEVFSDEAVNTTYQRFSALRIFNGVNMQLSKGDSAKVDCNINLSESTTQGSKLNFELSYSSSALIGISPQINWYHKNLFHGGEWLNLGFTGNFQYRPSDKVNSTEFGINTSLSLPRFLGLPISLFDGPHIPRTEFNASYNYQSRPEFVRNVANFNFGYSWRLKDKFYCQLYPLRATFVTLANVDPDFQENLSLNPFMNDSYSSHFDLGLQAMLYHSTNTELVPKTSYHYERFNFSLSGNLLSLFKNMMPSGSDGRAVVMGAPFSQYIRAELVLGRTFRIGHDEKSSIATRLDIGAGYAYGNSFNMPFEEQFYCGGASSMRGWQARTLGPGFESQSQYFSIPSQTGNFKIEADLEYRYPIFWKLEGALFAEVGNVWNLKSEKLDLLRSLAADWGLGLRVNLDFIIARLDLGVKLYEPSRAIGYRWIAPSQWFKSESLALHFGIGYPF